MQNNSKRRPFVNPYNFIPFGETITRAGHKKSREEVYRGREQLMSGWLDISIDLKTPLIIPDGAKPIYIDPSTQKELDNPTDDQKKKVHKKHSFFRLPREGELVPAIPGSELRGMIRSVYEAASDSCVPFLLNDKPISQRVPIFGSLQKRGLLGYDTDNGCWTLYRTSVIKELVYFTQNGIFYQDTDSPLDTAHIYPGAEIAGKGVVQYNIPVVKNKPYHIAYLRKAEDNSVEYTWRAGETMPYDKLKSALMRDGAPKTSTNPNKDAVAKLMSALENARMGKGNLVPVWYFKVSYADHSKKKEIIYMSGSSIGRIAQRRKWDEIMGDYKPCSDTSELCPACLLFGTVRGKGLKGHVRFSDALPNRPEAIKTEYHTLQILAEPRTSAFEFYLRRPDNARYWNFDFYGTKPEEDSKAPMEYHHLDKATPRGRKMYWHSSVAKEDAMSPLNTTKEAVMGGTFQFRLFFDRITERQLKELIWTVTLGENSENSNYQHKLGYAKPLGYGSVKLVVKNCIVRRIRLIDGQMKYLQEQYPVDASSCPFDETSDTLQSLLALCDATRTSGMTVMYPRYLKVNKAGVKDDNVYQWFTNNRTSAYRLVTLPEPTAPDITLYGSWQETEADRISTGEASPAVTLEQGCEYIAEITECIPDNKLQDKWVARVIVDGMEGKAFDLPAMLSGNIRIKVNKVTDTKFYSIYSGLA